MYSFPQVVSGLRNPQYLAWEINRAYYSFRCDSEFNDGGTDIFEEDWDTLVILDACRYDIFSAHESLPGDTEKRRSKASMTREWVRANFAERDLRDTVYVTAINQIQAIPKEQRPDLHDFVWVNDPEDTVTAGDMKTTSPEAITRHARQALNAYPNKRLVVHYGQPHQPYLGEIGKKFTWRYDFHENVARSDVTQSEVREAYVETLDIVLSEVESLLEKLPGRTVVSADHGEMLGERMWPVPIKHYGHPDGIYVDELIEIPWHVHETGERRRITRDDNCVDLSGEDRDEIASHLEAMGYV
ncbi:alkaline phosphatase family protein [Halobellus captivus]|uniref:hypothetical protein n=1 Tax=Halobellus captivus TaxID=2592614 RepID=UPI00119CF921|nr:hypothetical protein [Halobellus captivus]